MKKPDARRTLEVLAIICRARFRAYCEHVEEIRARQAKHPADWAYRHGLWWLDEMAATSTEARAHENFTVLRDIDQANGLTCICSVCNPKVKEQVPA